MGRLSWGRCPGRPHQGDVGGVGGASETKIKEHRAAWHLVKEVFSGHHLLRKMSKRSDMDMTDLWSLDRETQIHSTDPAGDLRRGCFAVLRCDLRPRRFPQATTGGRSNTSFGPEPGSNLSSKTVVGRRPSHEIDQFCLRSLVLAGNRSV